VLERYLIVTAGITLAAWGCSSSPVAPTPSANPPAPTAPASPAGPPTVTVSATGFSPLEITVPVAARVTFVNTDRIGHDIVGGLDHESRDCPEVEVVGFLVPGQSRETATFDQARTCRFHDHANVGNPAYQGRIVVR
jgi:plastocyanin